MKGITGRVGAMESSEALPLPSGQRSGLLISQFWVPVGHCFFGDFYHGIV